MIAEASFISIVVIMVAFYLITIRPGVQEQKRHEQTIRDLQVGDEVETTAGFLGTVKAIHTPETGRVRLVLDFGNGIEINALATSVAKRISTEAERAEQAAERGDARASEESLEEARKS